MYSNVTGALVDLFCCDFYLIYVSLAFCVVDLSLVKKYNPYDCLASFEQA